MNMVKSERQTRRFLGRYHIMAIWLIVILALLTLCYIWHCHVYRAFFLSSSAFIGFMWEWGGVIGILATVMVGFLVGTIPSTVEHNVKAISERLQAPVAGFPAVFSKAYDLLASLEDDPDSHFFMVSATPVFGLELNEEDRKRWATALRKRIVANAPTKIICLRWQPIEDESTTPLSEFCGTLAGSNKDSDHTRTEHALHAKAMQDISSFLPLTAVHENSEVRVCTDPPFQVILAEYASKSKSAGMLYFASTHTLRRRVTVRGIRSEDDNWTGLMKELFDFVYEHSEDVEGIDPRTDIQKKRDKDLTSHFVDHTEPYNATLFDIVVKVNPEVFPPDKALETEMLMKALRSKIGLYIEDIEKSKLIGIDVGTGTGIIAIALSRICHKVYATDNYEPAIQNARQNIDTYNLSDRITLHNCDLVTEIPRLPGDCFPIVVFAFPYYPSLYNIYNIGANDAGTDIIKRFLNQVTRIVSGKGIVLLPYSEISGQHNPELIAKEQCFQCKELLKRKNKRFGKNDYVYVLTKKA